MSEKLLTNKAFLVVEDALKIEREKQLKHLRKDQKKREREILNFSQKKKREQRGKGK